MVDHSDKRSSPVMGESMTIKISSVNDLNTWLSKHSVSLNKRFKPVLPSLYKAVEFPSRIASWSSAAISYVISALQEHDYRGGLLIISNWDFGSPELDRIGHCLIQSFVEGQKIDVTRPVAFVLGTEEFVVYQSLLTIAIEFAWDAYFVPEDCSFLLLVSHDDIITLVSTTENQHIKIIKQVENLGFRECPLPSWLGKSSM